MNPTLINGFEDIVAHIKNQEQRIMALEEENKKLKQTCLRWQEKADFNLDMSCDECGLTTTEDDLQISLKHGSLICEGCYDEKEEEYQPKGSRIDPEGLHDFMKEQYEEKIKNLEEKNKKLTEEMKYSTLLTGETIQEYYDDDNMTDEIAEEIAEDYKASISEYLYDKMKECIDETIDFEDYLEEEEEEDEDEQK